MSGLGELGELPGFTPGYGGQVAQRDIDQYYNVQIQNPSVDGSWIGTASGTVTAQTAPTIKNAYMDWPRNAKYALNGITNGTYGGTFVAVWEDQFGAIITETVAVPAAVNGGTVFGTSINYKYLSGSFISQGSAGTFIGTASIGVGTTTSGTAQNNWFGLLTKIGAVSDVKLVRWVNNGTVANFANTGTGIGTQVSLSQHAFQGTSGVATTDTLDTFLKTTFDNNGKGTMSNAQI
jgi:hypothetical protein